MQNVTVLDHPLILDKLTRMRDQSTSTATFRNLTREIAFLMGYETLRCVETTSEIITTPLTKFAAPVLRNPDIVFAAIMRAGNAMLTGLLDLMPTARVGFIGLKRREESFGEENFGEENFGEENFGEKKFRMEQYYLNLPPNPGGAPLLVCDPMLATGNTAAAAVDLVKQAEADRISFICLLAAPEGVENFHKRHPDVPIMTAAIDSHLNDRGLIVPGFGNAGDRLFGTL